MSVIVASFKQPTPPAQADLDEVKALARKAALFLGSHTRTTVVVKQVSVCAFGAFVPGYGSFRLGVVVGSYSKLRGMPIGGDPVEWAKMRDAAPREFRVEVVADVEWLKESVARDHRRVRWGYTDPEFKTVHQALCWIEANCLKAPVARVPAKEIAEWEKKTITVGVGSENERKMTLFKAVTVYGPMYSYGITPEVLVENHGIALQEAKLISDCVLKHLPKRKSS